MRWEDQQKINTFGRLNNRMHDLEDEIKEKRSKAELLDDAANELILADDDEAVRCASLHSLRPVRVRRDVWSPGARVRGVG